MAAKSTSTQPLCSISDLLGEPVRWWHWGPTGGPFPRIAWCGTICTQLRDPTQPTRECPDCARINANK